MVRTPSFLVPGAALLALAFVAGACSSGSTESAATTTPTTDAGTTPAVTTPGDPNVLAGTFQVKVGEFSAVSFIGKVYDGPPLTDVIWEASLTEGDCKLLVPRVPFCNTPCGSGAACVENDVCKPYPVAHSVGEVTVTGVKDTTGGSSFTMKPVANSYQPAGGIQLAFPPFVEGAALKLVAAGDYYGSFTIETKGVLPLVPGFDSLALAKGKGAKLTWSVPGAEAGTKIDVKLDISHHGGIKGKVECTTADDGELELSATMISALIDLGVAGWPTIVVARKAVGSTTISPGRVEFIASSEVERAITLEGVVSCTDSSQCPQGQTCQNDLTCK